MKSINRNARLRCDRLEDNGRFWPWVNTDETETLRLGIAIYWTRRSLETAQHVSKCLCYPRLSCNIKIKMYRYLLNRWQKLIRCLFFFERNLATYLLAFLWKICGNRKSFFGSMSLKYASSVQFGILETSSFRALKNIEL